MGGRPIARAVALTALALVACLSLSAERAGATPPAPPAKASQDVGAEVKLAAGTTVILVADPGLFSATPEAVHFFNNLKDRRDAPAGAVACPQLVLGMLLQQPVAVAVSGIGPMAAAVCTYDLMARFGAQVKDVFWAGTSGWSPQAGGIINNGTCERGAANLNGQFTRIGDLCVNSLSANWDCRAASWAQTSAGTPNQCTFPQQELGPKNAELFGQCMFANLTGGNQALADEVVAVLAAKGAANMPKRNNAVQAMENTYWTAMAKGAGLQMPSLPQNASPRVWGPRECVEVDSQYFWSGAPWDMVARAYAAQALAAAYGAGTPGQGGVVVVSAMEAIGLSMGMQRYAELRRTPPPYVYVRGMSNWDQPPLEHKGGGEWRHGAPVDDFVIGYKYAIGTSSAAVLATLQARCERQSGGRRPLASCDFTISYS